MGRLTLGTDGQLPERLGPGLGCLPIHVEYDHKPPSTLIKDNGRVSSVVISPTVAQRNLNIPFYKKGRN